MKVQKVCKELQMITAEAQEILRHLVVRTAWNSTRQSVLAQVARHLGWPYSRTFNIFYGRAKRIDAHEWIKLNEEFAALRESAKDRQGALHELEVLARASAQTHREMARPPSMDTRPQGEAASGERNLRRG